MWVSTERSYRLIQTPFKSAKKSRQKSLLRTKVITFLRKCATLQYTFKVQGTVQKEFVHPLVPVLGLVPVPLPLQRANLILICSWSVHPFPILVPLPLKLSAYEPFSCAAAKYIPSLLLKSSNPDCVMMTKA